MKKRFLQEDDLDFYNKMIVQIFGTIFFFGLFVCVFVFSDGEIISQIKLTNLALAEIKEFLKQQVEKKQQHMHNMSSHSPEDLHSVQLNITHRKQATDGI